MPATMKRTKYSALFFKSPACVWPSEMRSMRRSNTLITRAPTAYR